MTTTNLQACFWTYLILSNKAIWLNRLLPLEEDHVIKWGEGEWLRCNASGNYKKLSEQTFVSKSEVLIPQWATSVNTTEINAAEAQNNEPHEPSQTDGASRRTSIDEGNFIYELHQLCNCNADKRKDIKPGYLIFISHHSAVKYVNEYVRPLLLNWFLNSSETIWECIYLILERVNSSFGQLPDSLGYVWTYRRETDCYVRFRPPAKERAKQLSRHLFLNCVRLEDIQ